MTSWTSDELTRIAAAAELQVASRRRAGTLGRPVTIWVVRRGYDLYVRSINGRAAAWFRGTQVRLEGHVSAGGIEKDVDFVDADRDLEDELDAAYRAKYGRYGPGSVGSTLTPKARAATLKLLPRQTSPKWQGDARPTPMPRAEDDDET